MGHEDWTVAGRGHRHLTHYGGRAFEALVGACGEGPLLTRCRAAMILGRFRDPRAFPVLVAMLEDPAPEIRYDAAMALGLLGDLQALPILLTKARLREIGDEVAYGATQGLCELGKEAVPALLQALPKASETVQQTIVWALMRAGDPHVLPVLRAMLPEASPSLRETLEEAIEEIEAMPDSG